MPEGLTGAVDVAAGYGFTLALKDDGAVVAWDTDGAESWPVPAELTDVMAVAAGSECTVALKNDGTVIVWNYDYDWVGVFPVPTGLTDVVAVATGDYYVMALTDDGIVVTWEYYSGARSYVPPDLHDVIAMAACDRDWYSGGSAMAALRRDGTVEVWSASGESYSYPDMPQPEWTTWSGVVDIAATGSSVIALMDDGTVAALWTYSDGDPWSPWGGMGECYIPPGLTGITAIAAGGNRAVALLQEKVPGVVVFERLTETFTREPVEVTCTTEPSGLSVTYTYDGSDAAPSEIGTYTVVASIQSWGYVGTTMGQLVIDDRTNQTITFGALPLGVLGDADIELAATASSGLPVAYASSDPAVATIVDGRIRLSAPGTVVITASQPGDDAWFPAPGVTQSLLVIHPADAAQALWGDPDGDGLINAEEHAYAV